jgi:polyhydroxyalkanoate synthesis regulator phasin
MIRSMRFMGWIELGLLLATCVPLAHAQSLLTELKAQHDPGKRSEMALSFADEAFDNARDFYAKGEIEKGDEQLEQMTNVLNECVVSAETAHKPKFYKKAEQNVATLQRRIKSLLDDLELQKRGWAEYTDRKLEEIHDKLLAGVMRK